MKTRVVIPWSKQSFASPRISKRSLLRIGMGWLAAVAAGSWDWDSLDKSPGPSPPKLDAPILRDNIGNQPANCPWPSSTAGPCFMVAATQPPHQSIDELIREISGHNR